MPSFIPATAKALPEASGSLAAEGSSDSDRALGPQRRPDRLYFMLMQVGRREEREGKRAGGRGTRERVKNGGKERAGQELCLARAVDGGRDS